MRRGLVLGAEPGEQGFTCGSHPLVPANRTIWADQSGPSVQAVLLGPLSRKNSQTLPERHFPDAQKELSFLSLGSLIGVP